MPEVPKEPLTVLERCIGYRFRDISLLKSALTHRSYVNENQGSGRIDDNERQEFLGDAVLQLAVSELLYSRFPNFSEGMLTKVRASLVTDQALSRLAVSYGIGDFLLLGRGEEASGGREKESLLANALEAVMAAIFGDGGYEAAQKFIKKTFEPLLDDLENERLYHDYKSRLQELSHELFQSIPSYRIRGTRGPDHDKTFEVEVDIERTVRAAGSGKSKKEAEQQAARRALDVILARNDGESP
ncbi:MAG: ribonuclease III [Syntrophales bacterium]|jgi:ribonuclease III|nr:ribonuclease III [Syntrophales bacterium]MCK9528200.1 ribonuclease III [Syntrophales bacterium]MDX9921347.1 ribonuclease III [Syntrophales bacterium]